MSDRSQVLDIIIRETVSCLSLSKQLCITEYERKLTCSFILSRENITLSVTGGGKYTINITYFKTYISEVHRSLLWNNDQTFQEEVDWTFLSVKDSTELNFSNKRQV